MQYILNNPIKFNHVTLFSLESGLIYTSYIQYFLITAII